MGTGSTHLSLLLLLNTIENLENGLLNTPKKTLEVGEKRGNQLRVLGSGEINGIEFPGFSFDHTFCRFRAKQTSNSEMSRGIDQKKILKVCFF